MDRCRPQKDCDGHKLPGTAQHSCWQLSTDEPPAGRALEQVTAAQLLLGAGMGQTEEGMGPQSAPTLQLGNAETLQLEANMTPAQDLACREAMQGIMPRC